MKHPVENLQDLYVENYLQPIGATADTVVTESSQDDDENLEVLEEAKKKKKVADDEDVKGKKKKGKKKGYKWTPDMYNDSVSFDSHFDRLLREFDEGEGDFGAEPDSEYNFDEEGDDEQITVSKSVLRSIVDQLQDLLGDSVGDEEGFEGEEDSDDIPLESVDRESAGVYHGDQGNYGGKANKQAKSKFVKDNGDADFSEQDTGFDPEDTEGSEGAEHGDQGNYDGKARKQEKSKFVKDNGDADFGKQRTGYGKKEKEDLF